MMNKRGMTIVELITALVLISVVLIFMLNLLITVQNYGTQNQNTSDLLINQAVIIKAIEKDINEYNLVGIAPCTNTDINKERRYSIIPLNATKIYCLKLTFNNENLTDNEGFLVQYTYDYKSADDIIKKNVVGYKRGSNQNIRESSIAMDPVNYPGKVTSSCSETVSNKCSLKITMPVIDEVGNNYDIVATYIYSYSDIPNGTAYIKGTGYGFVVE